MSWQALLGQEIYIRLPDNDIGFVYVVKYGGVTIRRGFVPAMDGEVARGKLSVQRDAGQDDAPDLE
jgi:hypothetical protein